MQARVRTWSLFEIDYWFSPLAWLDLNPQDNTTSNTTLNVCKLRAETQLLNLTEICYSEVCQVCQCSTCMCECVCMCVCVCICLYVCMCVLHQLLYWEAFHQLKILFLTLCQKPPPTSAQKILYSSILLCALTLLHVHLHGYCLLHFLTYFSVRPGISCTSSFKLLVPRPWLALIWYVQRYRDMSF